MTLFYSSTTLSNLSQLSRWHRYRMPFLLAAIGAGLCAHGSLSWYQWTAMPAAQIDAEVAAQTEIVLARLGPHLQPDADQQTLLRAQVRHEVQARAAQPLRDAQRWLGFGLMCLVVAAGHALFVRLSTAPNSD